VQVSFALCRAVRPSPSAQSIASAAVCKTVQREVVTASLLVLGPGMLCRQSAHPWKRDQSASPPDRR